MNINLCRCQADTRGSVHGFEHIVDELPDCVINIGHRIGDISQARVRETKDF